MTHISPDIREQARQAILAAYAARAAAEDGVADPMAAAREQMLQEAVSDATDPLMSLRRGTIDRALLGFVL